MDTVDATDGEIRFTANWGGKDRFCFIAAGAVDQDAGRKLGRVDAIAWVRDHLSRYQAEARAQHGDDDPSRIVIIAR